MPFFHLFDTSFPIFQINFFPANLKRTKSHNINMSGVYTAQPPYPSFRGRKSGSFRKFWNESDRDELDQATGIDCICIKSSVSVALQRFFYASFWSDTIFLVVGACYNALIHSFHPEACPSVVVRDGSNSNWCHVGLFFGRNLRTGTCMNFFLVDRFFVSKKSVYSLFFPSSLVWHILSTTKCRAVHFAISLYGQWW